MAKKTNEEEVKTLSAEETAEEVNDTENNGATITLDDDSGVRPLAADDYVENFEVGGKTYAVRDVEAQDSITQLNSDIASINSNLSRKDISSSITENISGAISRAYYCSGFVYISIDVQITSVGGVTIGTITDSAYIPSYTAPGAYCPIRQSDCAYSYGVYVSTSGVITIVGNNVMSNDNRFVICYPVNISA